MTYSENHTTRERPILFSAPMVRAILDGTKTQTRRIVKPQPLAGFPRVGDISFDGFHPHENVAQWSAEAIGGGYKSEFMVCPYGDPLDRLWVRETWGVVSNSWDDDGNMIDWTPDRPATPIHEMRFGRGYYSGHVIYAADGNHEWAGDDDGGGEPRSAWHPSIHMPRAASRIDLEIVSVRVERLQDISHDDALAEGVFDGRKLCDPDVPGAETADECSRRLRWPQRQYELLWNEINGAGSWDTNPWVWVVEFKLVTA